MCLQRQQRRQRAYSGFVEAANGSVCSDVEKTTEMCGSSRAHASSSTETLPRHGYLASGNEERRALPLYTPRPRLMLLGVVLVYDAV